MESGHSSRPTVDFYLDVSCPWSYLALQRLREAAIRTGTSIRYRPVLVDQILAVANPALAESRLDPVPARARYQAKDLADWVRYCGLRIRRPDRWPLVAEWAQRGVVAASTMTGGRPEAYLAAVFAALFADNRDIGELAVVEAAATEAGLETAGFAALIREDATRLEVERNGTELLEHGGFGTPTFIVAGDLYFGNDRLPLVESALARHAGMHLVLPGAHGA